LVTKVYEFGGGKVLEHMGGIYDFLEKKNMETLQQLELSTNHATSADSDNQKPVSENKLSFEEQKERNRVIRRLERKVDSLENDIHQLELKTEEIETKLSTPEGAADPTLYKSHEEMQQRISDTMTNWEKALLELEEMNDNE
jgi:ATP-binding cassette subfamily F protein 3